MRLIGHLASESSARKFGDFLFVQGIDNRLEFQSEEGWGVWVNDEDRLEAAKSLLESFRANPEAPEYETQAKAAALRAEREKGEEAWRKRLRDRRHLFRPLTWYGFGPLTFVLIVMSVVVFVLSRFGEDWERVKVLSIADWWISGSYIEWNPGLLEVRHGQVWRLFTPIFLHGGIAHIFFNMWWLKDLGSMIEGRQNSWLFASLVLVIASGSNVAQFYIGPGHSPYFGGMSGVVFGLLGYIWMRGKFDPGSGLFLHPSTVTMMMIWLVVCAVGLVPHVANTAHVAGLLIGMAWGYVSSLRFR